MVSRVLVQLLFVLQCLFNANLQCTTPFVNKLGSCVYVSDRTTSTTISWCDAAKFCQSIGGELLMDLNGLRAVNRQSPPLADFYYVGVTDLLIERHTSRDNWRFANGSVFPILGDSDWMPRLPNDKSVKDDFLVVSPAGLRDNPPDVNNNFVCQPIATPNSNLMGQADFLKLGDISPTYCYTDTAVKVQLECLTLCVLRWECRAALFNRVSAACRMLDFADSSVGNIIENDKDWVKFVKSY